MRRRRGGADRPELAAWSAVLEALPSAAWLFDVDGSCVHANAAAVALVGCGSAEAVCGPLAQHTARLGFRHADGRAVEAEDLPVHAALRGEAVDGLEVALRPPRDGDLLHLRYHARPVVFDGRVAGAVAIAEDVSPLRSLERERDRFRRDAEEARRLLQLVLDNAPVFVVLLRGPDLVVELANPPARELLPGDPTPGRRLADGLDPVLEEILIPDLRRSLRSTRPELFVDRPRPVRRTPTGALEEGWFTYRRVPLRLPDGDLGLLLVGHETTEQVRTRARLEEALRARDEFLTLLAHELRTPLTALTLQLRAVASAVEPLVTEAGGRQIGTFLEGASQSVRRLARLADDLSEAMREGPILELERERVDLREVIRDALDDVRAEARGLGCVVDVRAPQPVVGCWDRRRLRQLAISLLSNAIKFGRGHEVIVRLDQTDDQARLVISNRGIAVPAGQEERLFERYERAVSPLHFGGLGLGLYVARRIVASHGGRIAIDSGEEGTRVTVTLPTGPEGTVTATA